MYSVILIAAMTAPADSAAWGKHHGGCSCSGYSCAGSASNGACHGAGACYGYAFAGAARTFGFAGCYGSCYGSYTNYFSYWAAPANVQYGYGMPMHIGQPPMTPPPPPPGIGAPPVAPVEPAPAPKPAPKNPEKKTSEPKENTEIEIGQTAAPASVIVTLPADAILFANGVRMQQTSAERHFVTPTLESGIAYHYMFTVEMIRNGRTISEEREVAVKAGAEIRVNFNAPIDATGIAVLE